MRAAEKALAERGDQLIGEDERSAIRRALVELRDAVATDDHRLIRQKIQHLDDTSRHLAEEIMDGAVLAALKDRKASEVAEGYMERRENRKRVMERIPRPRERSASNLSAHGAIRNRPSTSRCDPVYRNVKKARLLTSPELRL